MTNLLEDLKKWVLEGDGHRSVNIKVGRAGDAQYFEVFVYDYKMMTGQHITKVEEIDLETELKRSLERQIRRATQMGIVVGA